MEEVLDIEKTLLKENERIDQFTQDGIQLIQSGDYFTMSIDAILLANFIELPSKAFNYIDFCSGNGVIPLLLSKKTDQPLLGIEIQAPLVDMAKRSARLNGVEDQVSFIQGDLNEYKRPANILYDIISCNPPYFLVVNSQETHKLSSHAIARHEIYLTMNQWVKKAKSLLKTKGKLYIVHRPDRLDDLFKTLEEYQFGINRLQFIYPKVGEQANGVMIEAIAQGGRRGVKIEPPIIVHEENGDYTQKMMAIYHG